MDKNLRQLLTAALFAAMTAALTFFVKIPVGNGYVHMGDSMIYLAACILPTRYAIIAAGLGGALSDALGGYAVFIVPTLIIKALITLPYESSGDTVLTKWNTLMVLPAGFINVLGYFFANLLIFGSGGAHIALIGDMIQAVGSAVLFILTAAMLDKIKLKKMLLN
ncbi:MAG: TIGR04002 family protein [Oscillospiraceae bacterium]|nr:TIGR04002 family protein [Oscillospiraceae bacterium]